MRQAELLDLLLWYWGRRGGPVRFTHDLARELAARGDIRLSLSLSRQSELFAETAALGVTGCHVDTYSGPISALAGLARLPALRAATARFVRERQVEVALCMMRHLWSSAIFPALRHGGARVLMMLHDAAPHPGEAYPLWRRHLALDLAATDGLVVLSEHVREAVCRDYGYPAARIWFAPHVSMNFTRAGTARPFPVGRPVRLLFFGRLLEYKGLDLLAEAYGCLSRQWPIELRVVGNGRVAALDALAALPGVQLDNRWIPEDEIGGILQQADLLVAPYREASQSGVVPSAYAAGLPVVATPVGGLAEQVADGMTGLVAPRADADALAGTIARLLGDPALYERCSAGALAASRGELEMRAVADRLCVAARALAALPPRV